MEIERDIPLAKFTTLKLGGRAAYFTRIEAESDLIFAYEFGRSHSLPIWIFGGGSNTIVPDDGYSGLVIKIEIKGKIASRHDHQTDIIWEVGAGEDWDSFVNATLSEGCTGVECLSGIPGTVGATPIQNIGAYGQEVSNTIVSVRFYDPILNEYMEVPASECEMTYRNSRFKSGDWSEKVITRVNFRLSTNLPICTKYPEVKKKWDEKTVAESKRESRIQELQSFRDIILALRKSKSMLIDDADLNTKSAGSFFTNPILTKAEKVSFLEKIGILGLTPPLLYPEPNDQYKISAAWLIENSGISKGLIRNGVGISSAHTLALINRNGTTRELLELARWVEDEVFKYFQVKLVREPVLLV